MFPLSTQEMFLFPPSTPQLLMAHLTNNVALGVREIYCICPEKAATSKVQITAKQQHLHRERW